MSPTLTIEVDVTGEVKKFIDSMSGAEKVLAEVLAEQVFQNEHHHHMPMEDWEWVQSIYNQCDGTLGRVDEVGFRERMKRIAATALRAIEAHDRDH